LKFLRIGVLAAVVAVFLLDMVGCGGSEHTSPEQGPSSARATAAVIRATERQRLRALAEP
jgi:hypothetical protein